MACVIHFEIMASNPTELAAFYEGVFGWEASTWEGPVEYHLLDTKSDGAGIDGAIMAREGPRPDPGDEQPMGGFICTVDVLEVVDGGHRGLEVAMAAIEEHGGRAGEAGDVPGVGWHAYAWDPDGNQFGLMESTE